MTITPVHQWADGASGMVRRAHLRLSSHGRQLSGHDWSRREARAGIYMNTPNTLPLRPAYGWSGFQFSSRTVGSASSLPRPCPLPSAACAGRIRRSIQFIGGLPSLPAGGRSRIGTWALPQTGPRGRANSRAIHCRQGFVPAAFSFHARQHVSRQSPDAAPCHLECLSHVVGFDAQDHRRDCVGSAQEIVGVSQHDGR